MSDEEVVLKFFKNLNLRPQNKDNFIRDFEDFYFKARPKFAPKLIRLLLEVIQEFRLILLLYRVT